MLAGERGEGHRLVGLAEGGRADRRDRLAAHRRQKPEGVQVGDLALVGPHPGGRVALGVLHRAVALLDRKAEVLGRHVVLEVDPGAHLVLRPVRGKLGDDADRPLPDLPACGHRRELRHRRLEARRLRRIDPGARALGKALRHAEEAVRGAGGALALPGARRAERLDLIVVAKLPRATARRARRSAPSRRRRRGGRIRSRSAFRRAASASAAARRRLRSAARPTFRRSSRCHRWRCRAARLRRDAPAPSPSGDRPPPRPRRRRARSRAPRPSRNRCWWRRRCASPAARRSGA